MSKYTIKLSHWCHIFVTYSFCTNLNYMKGQIYFREVTNLSDKKTLAGLLRTAVSLSSI